MNKITKNTLGLSIKEATSLLLSMAEKACWNRISDNACYIVSEIVHDKLNAFEKRIERKKLNDKKTPKSLEQITAELKDFYENLYDINLYIYKSEKERTIIEIQYYPKSSHEFDFYETIKDNAPMLHCKLALPPYRKKETEKFDVNWELGGIRHQWKSLWYKFKIK